MSEELKPCPFCGCEKIEIIQHFHPRCTRCGCIQESVIGCEAVPKWNGRIYDRLEQENAELREALRRIRNWNEIGLKKAIDIGSEGVKNYYRNIAELALNK